MDKMREEFEAWYSEFYIPQDASATWQPVVKAMALKAWQASRQALVVELPATCCRTLVFEIEGSSEVGMQHDEYYEVDDIHIALKDAGIKWTE